MLVINDLDKIKSITVVNILGQKVISRECNENNIQVNTATLPAGIYTIRITDDKGETVSKFRKE